MYAYPIEKSMLLITSWWGEKKSFKLMPVKADCPYVEVIYDSSAKLLIVVGKEIKSNFHMLSKLDGNGDPIPAKVKRKNGRQYQEERKTIETFTEHYVTEVSEQEAFIESFAVNAKEFDYKQYMKEEAPAEKAEATAETVS